MIAEYVERLARELDFDPALSLRMRREVEDHLLEAVARDRVGGPEAEKRAVANFGDPRAIAARFAVLSLVRWSRRVGVAAVLILAGVFITMKARVVWYGLMECPALEEFKTLSQVVGSIDRYAFWLAGLVGVAAWFYIDSRNVPSAFTREYRTQLRRFSLLCLATTSALLVSVASDGILTSLMMVGTGWSSAAWVPVLSMAVEIACAGVLVSYLRGTARRTMLASPA